MQDLVKRVLQKVNAIRAVAGQSLLDDLPQGERCQEESCPIARALPGTSRVGGRLELDRDLGPKAAAVLGHRSYESNGEAILDQDPDFRQFMQEFDRGALPQYEIGR